MFLVGADVVEAFFATVSGQAATRLFRLGQEVARNLFYVSGCDSFCVDRAAVRDRSARSALQILRFSLLQIADDVVLLWEAPVRDSAAVC